jgi:hypothetical protein
MTVVCVPFYAVYLRIWKCLKGSITVNVCQMNLVRNCEIATQTLFIQQQQHSATNNATTEKPYLKVRSSAEKRLLLSLVSASTTNCRRLSYMTGSKNAKSWNLIDRPRIYFIT